MHWTLILIINTWHYIKVCSYIHSKFCVQYSIILANTLLHKGSFISLLPDVLIVRHLEDNKLVHSMCVYHASCNVTELGVDHKSCLISEVATNYVFIPITTSYVRSYSA